MKDPCVSDVTSGEENGREMCVVQMVTDFLRFSKSDFIIVSALS